MPTPTVQPKPPSAARVVCAKPEIFHVPFGILVVLEPELGRARTASWSWGRLWSRVSEVP